MVRFYEPQSRLFVLMLTFVFLVIIGVGFRLYVGEFSSAALLLNLYLILYPSIIVLLIVMLSIGVGQAALQLLRVSFPRYRYEYYFSTLLGLGIISHAVLFVGLVQGYRHHWVMLALLIGLLAVARRIATFLRLFGQWLSRQFASQWNAAEMLMLFFVAVCMLLYFSAATLPPISYDVLEYHLGVPKTYIQHGGICPVPHNFFSCLPSSVEMLYVLGLLLEGGITDGTPHTISFVFYVLSGAGIVLLLSRLRLRRIWWLAGLVLLSIHPIVFKSGLDAFNDLGTSGFVIAGLVAWVLWIQERERSFFVLSAIFLGFALTTKYTALGLYVFPYCVVLLPLGLFLRIKVGSAPRLSTRDADQSSTTVAPSNGSRVQLLQFMRHYAGHLISFAGIIVLVFAPITIKNLVSAGSPFYPFLPTIFPVSSWSPAQAEFLVRAHHPVPILSSTYFATVLRRTAIPGIIFVAVPILVLFLRKLVSIEAGLMAYGVVSFMVWNVLAQSADRFLTSFIAVAVILVIVVISDFASWFIAGAIALCACALFGLAGMYTLLAKSQAIGIPQVALAIESRNEFQKRLAGPLADAAEFVNTQLEEDAKLLFIYEARTYLFDREVIANTVFDQSPLLLMAKEVSSGQALADRLKAQGVTYCLVNEHELIRLIQFYGPRDQLRERGLEPLLQSAPQRLIHYPEFYAPYVLDPDYPQHEKKLNQFMLLLRQTAVFQVGREGGPQLYISRLP